MLYYRCVCTHTTKSTVIAAKNVTVFRLLFSLNHVFLNLKVTFNFQQENLLCLFLSTFRRYIEQNTFVLKSVV